MNRCLPFDLSGAFTGPIWFAPSDDGAPDPDEPRDTHPPAPADPPPSDTAGAEDGGGDDTDGDIKDPKAKRLSDEAAAQRVRAKAAEDEARQGRVRLGAAEAQVRTLTDQVRTLTLRLAFNEAAHVVNITDLDAAWKLAADDLKAVELADDGSVDMGRVGMIAAHVTQRYPYLTSDPAPAPTTAPTNLPVSGDANAGRRPRKADPGPDRRAMEAKFPALRRAR